MTTRAAQDPSVVPANLVVLAGVPGAGKSTALRALAGRLPHARILDPQQLHDWVLTVQPDLPYRRYRWLVHTVHHLRVAWFLLLGPRRGQLVLHDPGTRGRVRRVLVRLARWRRWRPALVFIDVTAEVATQGQHARARVVEASSFAGHWQRWSQLREAAGAGYIPGERWHRIRVAPRKDVVDTVTEEVETGALAGGGGRS